MSGWHQQQIELQQLKAEVLELKQRTEQLQLEADKPWWQKAWEWATHGLCRGLELGYQASTIAVDWGWKQVQEVIRHVNHAFAVAVNEGHTLCMWAYPAASWMYFHSVQAFATAMVLAGEAVVLCTATTLLFISILCCPVIAVLSPVIRALMAMMDCLISLGAVIANWLRNEWNDAYAAAVDMCGFFVNTFFTIAMLLSVMVTWPFLLMSLFSDETC